MSDSDYTVEDPDGDEGDRRLAEPGLAEPAKAESQTEELFALLPPAIAKELDQDANKPIYPDAIDLGIADYDKTNPAVWASDWRLQAPPESDAYKEAIEHPRYISADADAQQVIGTIVKSLSPDD